MFLYYRFIFVEMDMFGESIHVFTCFVAFVRVFLNAKFEQVRLRSS